MAILRALFGSKSAPVASASGPGGGGAAAPAAAAPAQAPGFYRMRVGEAIVTALHEGYQERPLEGLVKNTSVNNVKAALAAAFMKPDVFTTFYNPLLIETAGKRILIDPGFADNGPPTTGQLARNMAAAGITPASIDIVLITHFHGDHIQGIRSKAGELVYPNARILVPIKEWDYWMDDANAAKATPQLQISFNASRRVFGPIANEVVKFAWGDEIVPGLTSLAVPGHAPGMSGFILKSGGETLLVQADVTNLPALFMRNPGWHLAFDMDPEMAEETRRRVFDMASAERMLVSGYHYPFPALGHITKEQDGYDLHLVTWQSKV